MGRWYTLEHRENDEWDRINKTGFSSTGPRFMGFSEDRDGDHPSDGKEGSVPVYVLLKKFDVFFIPG